MKRNQAKRVKNNVRKKIKNEGFKAWKKIEKVKSTSRR